MHVCIILYIHYMYMCVRMPIYMSTFLQNALCIILSQLPCRICMLVVYRVILTPQVNVTFLSILEYFAEKYLQMSQISRKITLCYCVLARDCVHY